MPRRASGPSASCGWRRSAAAGSPAVAACGRERRRRPSAAVLLLDLRDDVARRSSQRPSAIAADLLLAGGVRTFAVPLGQFRPERPVGDFSRLRPSWRPASRRRLRLAFAGDSFSPWRGSTANGFGVEPDRALRSEERGDLPVFLGLERLDLALASTIRRSATDCTRPALKPRVTFWPSRLLSG